MKNTQGKTGQNPGRTPEQTNRRDESKSNARQDQTQRQNPQTDTDPRKQPQEPKRFEEQPIKPSQQPQGHGKDWQKTEEDEDAPAKKGRNVNPADEKHLSEKDQYIPGRKDNERISEGPTESDDRR